MICVAIMCEFCASLGTLRGVLRQGRGSDETSYGSIRGLELTTSENRGLPVQLVLLCLPRIGREYYHNVENCVVLLQLRDTAIEFNAI